MSGAAPSVAAGSSPPAEPRPAAGALAAKLAPLGLSFAMPEGWVEEAPASPMRLGTIRLPRAEGDAVDGEVSVSQAGGSVEANVERWRGQFQERPQPGLTSKEVAGLKVSLVELEGTFSAGPMAAAAAPASGTRLVGIIVSVPGTEGLIFFKAWGPRATMERWKDSFQALVASFKPSR